MRQMNTQNSKNAIFFVLVASLILLLTGIDHSTFAHKFSDAWEHTAALAELIRDPINPANPHVASNETSARFMPLYVAAGLIGNWLSLDTLPVYRGIELFNISLLLLGVFLFSRTYFPGHSSAPLWLLAVMIGAWGTGIVWSNSTNLRSLLFVAGYPSTAATGLTLIVWTLGLKTFSAQRLRAGALLVGVMLLTTLTVLTHLLTGAVAVGGLALMSIVQRDASATRRIGLLAAMAVGVLAVEIWPYYSTLDIFAGASRLPSASAPVQPGEGRVRSLLSHHLFYQPVSIALSLGIYLLAIPLSLRYLLSGRHLFAVLGMWGLLGVYLLNLFTPIPLGHRALLFSIFFGDLVLVAYAFESVERLRTKDRRIRTSALLYLGGLAISLLLSIGLAARATYQAHTWPTPLVAQYSNISSYIPARAVVMANPENGWPLPTFSGKVVYPAHGNPFIADTLQRFLDVTRFFSRKASYPERRSIIQKWGVEYLLLGLDDRERQQLEDSFCQRPLEQQGDLILCATGQR